MIIRQTMIMEAWCDNCSEGQIGHLLEESFSKKNSNLNLHEYVGTKVKCKHCGHENEIEDLMLIIPIGYFVHGPMTSKSKSNNELQKWLEK